MDKEYRNELLSCLLRLLHRKMELLSELLRLTEQIGDALSRNDRVSVDIVLEMRAEEIENYDQLLKEINTYKDSFSGETKQLIEQLLRGEAEQTSETDIRRIVQFSKSCEALMSQIVQKDKAISRRVAGNDSFYDGK